MMVIRWIELKSRDNWMNRQKVLVFGFYGEGNLGDELLLNILLQWTQNLEIEIISLLAQ